MLVYKKKYNLNKLQVKKKIIYHLKKIQILMTLTIKNLTKKKIEDVPKKLKKDLFVLMITVKKVMEVMYL